MHLKIKKFPKVLCCMQMEEEDGSPPDEQPYPAQQALQEQHPGNLFAAGNTPHATADHVATPFRLPSAAFSSPMTLSLRGQAMPGKQLCSCSACFLISSLRIAHPEHRELEQMR